MGNVMLGLRMDVFINVNRDGYTDVHSVTLGSFTFQPNMTSDRGVILALLGRLPAETAVHREVGNLEAREGIGGVRPANGGGQLQPGRDLGIDELQDGGMNAGTDDLLARFGLPAELLGAVRRVVDIGL